MFLRSTTRLKDGKIHYYWSIVENRRCRADRVVQQTVLYLGEINDSQREQWIRAIEVFDEDAGAMDQLKLFAAERRLLTTAPDRVQVRLKDFELHRPRQWGGCWLFSELWKQLQLDEFWRVRLGCSREGTDWEHVLQTLVCYRLLDPGSEWRLHRVWFEHSAMGDLLAEDFSIAAKDTLYRCLDSLLEHKAELFEFLHQRWAALFGAKFDVLLYDLTSTYFESDPPFPEGDKRRHGYSRDHRPDCAQVVIALIVTPEGLPLAYEVLAGNTSDKTTLKDFLHRIEKQYGKAQRIWLMDRGIPTEATLAEMRLSDPPGQYLVGTPKGRLAKLEQALLSTPWQKARENVSVKLLPQDDELYVFAESKDRVAKERAMRRRQLKWLWKRLAQVAAMKLKREELLMKLGSARSQAPTAWRLVNIKVDPKLASFTYALNRNELAKVRRREGRYLLRTNLCDSNPAKLWELYLTLVKIEEAFKNLKSDLALRPIFHQREDRIEAHIFIAFLAYCLHVTLDRRLHALAPGLTPRSVFEKFAAVQMIDVSIPTTDGRTLTLTRYTEPEPELKLLLEKLKLELPQQPPPKITALQLPSPTSL